MEVILICGNTDFGKVSVLQQVIKERELCSLGVAVGFSYYFDDEVVVIFNGNPERKHWKYFSDNVARGRKIIVECTKFANYKFWRMAIPHITVIKIVGGGKPKNEKELQLIAAKYNCWNTDTAYQALLSLI